MSRLVIVEEKSPQYTMKSWSSLRIGDLYTSTDESRLRQKVSATKFVFLDDPELRHWDKNHYQEKVIFCDATLTWHPRVKT